MKQVCRNWPVPRTLSIGTGGGLVLLSALTVQLISEILLSFQSENRRKIKHEKKCMQRMHIF